jgi:hypothetical protein
MAKQPEQETDSPSQPPAKTEPVETTNLMKGRIKAWEADSNDETKAAALAMLKSVGGPVEVEGKVYSVNAKGDGIETKAAPKKPKAEPEMAKPETKAEPKHWK